MRLTTITIFLFSCFSLFSQIEVKETTNSSEEIYSGAARQSIEAVYNESGDTSYIFFFQDARYTQIIEIKSIAFLSKTELLQFLDLVDKAIEEGKEFKTSICSISSGLNKKTVRITADKPFTYLSRKITSKIRSELTDHGHI